MCFINWLKANLEYFYYVAGIIVSSSIMISILRFNWSKKETKKNEKRITNKETTDLLIDYYQNIIPSFSKIKKALKGNIYSIDRNDLFKYSRELEKNTKEYYKRLDSRLFSDFEELLSFMQSFSVKYELSDCNQEAIEKTVAKSFSDIFEIIVPCLIENGFEYYKELIDTYNTFNLNIRKLEAKKQLIDTETKIEENLLIKKANGIKKE